MNNRIVKNASWIIICRVGQSILNVIVSMIMARYLGPSNYGITSYAASLVTFIVPLVQLGLNNILVHEIVSNPNKEGETLGTALVISTISAFLGIGVVSAISFLLNQGEKETIVVCILYSISLVFQMTEMIQYWYQAKLLSKYVALTSLISRVIVSAYKIYIVIRGKNIYWFAIVNSLDYLIISILLYWLYLKFGKQKLFFSLNRAKHLIEKGKHFIIPGLMISIFSQTDRIMLKLMIGNEASGYYSAAVTCAGMTVFVFSAIIESCRPVIFENRKINQKLYENSIVNMYSIILYMAFIQSVILTIGAELVVTILYGKEFMTTVPILRIITWQSAFSYIGSANNVWMLAEDKHRYLWKINVSGAIVNVIGNAFLIPFYGACGAAMASLLTQLFTNYILYFIIKSFRPNGILLLKALNPKVIVDILKKLSKRGK